MTSVVSLGADDTILVGDAAHHSCVGDSGGPALAMIGGVETIVGVDSYTESTGCIEPANYRRTDVYADFINMYAPPAPVDAGTDGGGGTGAGGMSGHGGTGQGGIGAGGNAATSATTGGSVDDSPISDDALLDGGGAPRLRVAPKGSISAALP